jgi:biotin synthase
MMISSFALRENFCNINFVMEKKEALEILSKLDPREFPPPQEILLSLKKIDTLTEIVELLKIATKLREYYFGKEVELCAIINAKSGLCPEDCAFCSQSSRSKAKIPVYPLKEPEEILEKALEAKNEGKARRLSIVTSGRGNFTKKEKQKILKAVELIREKAGMLPDASLGMVEKEFLMDLKKAGLARFHNNLETSASFYPKIVTTHRQEEKIKVIRDAKEIGLEVCSGGILGLGESFEQRIEMAFQLRELDVDSVPINFLHPIPGTPLEGANYITPMEALKSVILFRFILPDKHILIAGGREYLMKDLHPLLLLAGKTHSTVGAVLGIGLAYTYIHGVARINWNVVYMVVSSWIISPLLAILQSGLKLDLLKPIRQELKKQTLVILKFV